MRWAARTCCALPPERRPINLMFQSYALFPHMSVEQNVAYGLEREGRPRDEIRTRVAEVLRVVGITETASRRPSQLSGGQRQRVALARAIVKRPRLLLLDEPLSALDRKVREEMQLELKRLQHEVGITFVVVTHDQEEAMSMADRIAVMRRGRLEQLDGPVDLYERPGSLFVARFIGSNDLFEGVATDGGVDVAGVGLLPATSVTLAAGHARVAGHPPRARPGARARGPRGGPDGSRRGHPVPGRPVERGRGRRRAHGAGAGHPAGGREGRAGYPGGADMGSCESDGPARRVGARGPAAHRMSVTTDGRACRRSVGSGLTRDSAAGSIRAVR